VIDLHTHILPGLDDGPRTLAESISIARAAVADGIHIVAATPHVRADYSTSASEMEDGVAHLRQALAVEEIALEVRTGGEIALDHIDFLDAEELVRFGLAANPNYLLVEFPYYGWPLSLPSQLADLDRRGITAVVAHPERNVDIHAAPERLRAIVEQGALVQLTSASLDGRLGRNSRTAAFRLLDLGLAHLIASDAHAPGLRSVGMTAAANSVGDAELARWLTEDVPAAIVADAPIPERPRSRRRRFRHLWLPPRLERG
jgi:protein-tyrosine phosphatase